MRLTVYWPAGAHERFGPDMFGSAVGGQVPVTMDDATIGVGTVVAAVVDQDGAGVSLTLDLDPPDGVHPQTAGYDELLRIARDGASVGEEDPWRCPRCGSPRWVSASLTGPVSLGGRAIRQCVPCGHYSNDPVPN